MRRESAAAQRQSVREDANEGGERCGAGPAHSASKAKGRGEKQRA